MPYRLFVTSSKKDSVGSTLERIQAVDLTTQSRVSVLFVVKDSRERFNTTRGPFFRPTSPGRRSPDPAARSKAEQRTEGARRLTGLPRGGWCAVRCARFVSARPFAQRVPSRRPLSCRPSSKYNPVPHPPHTRWSRHSAASAACLLHAQKWTGRPQSRCVCAPPTYICTTASFASSAPLTPHNFPSPVVRYPICAAGCPLPENRRVCAPAARRMACLGRSPRRTTSLRRNPPWISTFSKASAAACSP